MPRQRTLISDDIFNKPDGRALSGVLVSVDLLLLEGPVGKILGMGPQCHLGRHVNEFEVAGLALEGLALWGVPCQLDLEQGVVVPAVVVPGPGGELLIGRHQRRSDVVSQEEGVCGHVQELDNVVVAHDTTTAGFWERLGGDDAPVVVQVAVSVTGDLLALATDTAILVGERILVGMGVEVNLGILVAESQDVVIVDI